VCGTGIGQFKLLRQLDIQNNRLTSLGEEMLDMNYLEELYLACNGIESVQGLPRSSRLNTLDLSNNPLKSIQGIQEVCVVLCCDVLCCYVVKLLYYILCWYILYCYVVKLVYCVVDLLCYVIVLSLQLLCCALLCCVSVLLYSLLTA
jgi:Leucine-rich repeat (LRR) protein